MRSKYISDYVYLAEASYADFTGITNDKESTERRIRNTKEANSKPESFAKLVTDYYTVEAHWQDRGNDDDPQMSESGFLGTLFKSMEGKLC